MSTSPGYPPAQSPQEFVEALLGLDSHQAWLAQMGPSTAGQDMQGGWAPGYYQQLQVGWAHYYSMALLKKGSKSRNNRSFGEAWTFVLDDVGVVPSIVGAKLDIEVVRNFAPAPSYIVETSHGNFQFGYVLAPRVSDVDQFRCFLNAIKNHPTWGPGLEGAGDPVHYYRLPSGSNHKNGFDTRLYRAYKGVTYTLDDLARHFGVDVSPAAVAYFVATGGKHVNQSPAEEISIPDLKALLAHIPNDKRFNARSEWVKMAHAIYSCTGSSTAGRELWVKWSETWDCGPFMSKAHVPGEAEMVWDTFGDEHFATAGSLRKWLEERNPGNYQARSAVPGDKFEDNPIDPARVQQAADDIDMPFTPAPGRKPKLKELYQAIRDIRSTTDEY